MIFTGNKALQFLSVPVYTILKNLTVIVIAYGEVIWFGGSVSALAFMSFALMIFSSVVAAWSDFRNAATAVGAAGVGIKDAASSSTSVSTLNAGYFWMLLNVFIAAMYALSMRKSMKSLQLKNWDGRSSHELHFLSSSSKYCNIADTSAQLYTTTTSSQSPSSSVPHSSLRTGPASISSPTSPLTPAGASSSA